MVACNADSSVKLYVLDIRLTQLSQLKLRCSNVPHNLCTWMKDIYLVRHVSPLERNICSPMSDILCTKSLCPHRFARNAVYTSVFVVLDPTDGMLFQSVEFLRIDLASVMWCVKALPIPQLSSKKLMGK